MVMLSLGTIFAQPISTKGPWLTLGVVAAMLATLAVLEWLQVKFDFLERLLSGKALVVIDNGVIQEDKLRMLRLTTDKLEMRLRQVGIKHISDVETATIEANGLLGYELKRDSEPLTIGQFERVMNSLIPDIARTLQTAEKDGFSIFAELKDDSANQPHPEHLN